jgi:hypothetical protein
MSFSIKRGLSMAMTELWKMPSPSSGLEGVAFKELPRRTCVLSFQYEDPDGAFATCELHFHDVAALRCTYLPALTADLIRSAYDKLVEIRNSPWLSEANSVRWDRPKPLRHLRICFDDGPCYEFLCAEFEIVGGEIEPR